MLPKTNSKMSISTSFPRILSCFDFMILKLVTHQGTKAEIVATIITDINSIFFTVCKQQAPRYFRRFIAQTGTGTTLCHVDVKRLPSLNCFQLLGKHYLFVSFTPEQNHKSFSLTYVRPNKSLRILCCSVLLLLPLLSRKIRIVCCNLASQPEADV